MSYHVDFSQEAARGICENCGSRLIQREDDREETVIKRLETYHAQTEPLIEYYRGKGNLLDVAGQNVIEETTAEVFKALGMNK